MTINLQASGALVKITNVTHSYESGGVSRNVLQDVSFSINEGEFVCIVGPPGVGKSTILRIIAGLQASSSGSVHVSGRVLNGPSPDVGLVFQDYGRSLMPWMSVQNNVALPLRGRKNRADRDRLVLDALSEVGLITHKDARPWQLSGGMQQRVAIARALAFGAPVLLMDEPFASVDAQTRAELEDLTLRVRSDTGQAVVLITHDVDEAIYLADRIIVLGGSPAAVLHEIVVPFGRDRHQLRTKALPQFGEIRTQVHTMIQEAAKAMTANAGISEKF